MLNKNINTNDGHSDISGTNNNNVYPKHSSLIIPKNSLKKAKNTFNKISGSIIKAKKSRDDLDFKPNKKNVVTLNTDVIVSGNEINPEKIYYKKKLLGSGAFGEVWLVTHIDLARDFAMKIIKKRRRN